MKKTTKVLLGSFLVLALFSPPVVARDSVMPDSNADMPQLKEKGVYTATGKEDWSKTTGFKTDSGMVDMMNQMMVGGSGMENMRMNMKMPETPQSGDDSMEMAAGSNMQGMDMGKPKKKSSHPASQVPVSIQAALKEGAPKVGKSTLVFTALDPATGKPIEKLNVSARVFMTSMDMGTDKPKIEELGKGQYQMNVTFTMAGPWRVELNIAIPGQKPFVKDFDFNVKMPD